MLQRSVLSGLILLVATATASAQTEFGLPNSIERQGYCQAAQPACQSAGQAYCQSLPDQPPDCLDDADTQCTKALSHCMEAQENVAPAPQFTAPASASCLSLFHRLHSYARSGPENGVPVLWTTNYFAHGIRFAGWSFFELHAQSRNLFGEGQRHRTFFSGAGTESENVSLRIGWDSRVMLGGQYGPYDTACSDDKFAVVHTGDSVETFHFYFPGNAIADEPPPEPSKEQDSESGTTTKDPILR